jgi:hypothetical protein
MSLSCFDMNLDKGGGRHGHHDCVRSVVGSLLSLLVNPNPPASRACWPITLRRRRKSGGVRGRQGKRRHGLSTGWCTLRRGGREAAPLLPTANAGAGRAIFATLAGATTTPPPSPPPTRTTMPTYAVGGRRGPGGGARCDTDRLLKKKYLVKKIIVMNIASV